MAQQQFRNGFEYEVFHAWDYPKYLKEGFYWHRIDDDEHAEFHGPFTSEDDADTDAQATWAIR